MEMTYRIGSPYSISLLSGHSQALLVPRVVRVPRCYRQADVCTAVLNPRELYPGRCRMWRCSCSLPEYGLAPATAATTLMLMLLPLPQALHCHCRCRCYCYCHCHSSTQILLLLLLLPRPLPLLLLRLLQLLLLRLVALQAAEKMAQQ